MLISHDKTENKKIFILIIVIMMMGIALLIVDYYDSQKNYSGTINRNETGEGSFSEKLLFETEKYSDEIEITVDDVRITEEQAKKLFDEAKVDIGTRYLGDNISENHVVTDLNFEERYANGLVEARWQLDNYEVVNTDGSIVEEKTSAEGTIVGATIFLSCGDYEEVYTLAFVVYEPDRDSRAGFIKTLKKAIKKADEDAAEKTTFILPNIVEEQSVIWKKPMDYRGLQIVILGLFTGVAIIIGAKKEQQKTKEKLISKKVADYPEIVSNLSILMGAGISFKGSIERMVTRYVRKKEQNPEFCREGYEELLKVHHEMRDGVGELEAIENLGRRSGCKEYRKLSMLLSQNLRKGSKDMIDMLEKEEALAFELRKQMALKAGEEASTKLLIPLLGMLAIVVVMLIFPATMQMNM